MRLDGVLEETTMPIRVAYCTGFWCTNVGNAFYSLGVEYALKQILGDENVVLVSDVQTYTTSYGKRLYPHRNQLEYLSKLKVDYIVLAGPVLSKYFLNLWKEILVCLERRGIRYIILSAGMMKMNSEALSECQSFFMQHPPYAFVSRDKETFDTFGSFAENAYDGICFSFFAPDYYHACGIADEYITLNFDKISEPKIWSDDNYADSSFTLDGAYIHIRDTGLFSKLSAKTDRFSDALIYVTSILPKKRRSNKIGKYTVYRPDHRFHPHFRSKIYGQANSFCADVPYGYLSLYANTYLTLSDRVHACAVTMAFGHSAMLFAKTNRIGLLERVGAKNITSQPTSLNMSFLDEEKDKMLDWISSIF